ncbi:MULTISPECIES: DNA polymerase IV [Sphingobacterium]|jgi:DNA polymerase-4|uniref:DNA polymerase IV n=2 Tax=Sphingobacterium multivorum TaxID=28454 RepID=A0A654DRM4_SPHMU|nr:MULTISPECIES: DNA polymerase IV [Sphingobacterium]QQT46464.1 DNA polymerase IV [Sphingobacterium multivorum]SUI96805.1 DNA polymerase IV [Sphingobacterium multivorum]VXD07868.1 DNA polymerase IV [Sphingobacterium multivorum]HAE67250.1 DNA polymerase IV [Sphingobacterium sp.]
MDPEQVHRKIIHLDMDAFYASVDQRDFPEYRGKAIAVGGSPDGRGVVATASYEARKFGVKSAMSSRKALQLCPHIIFTYPRFDVYRQVSYQIREIFLRYTDLIEPLSLDEAFLDVTVDKQGIGSAIDIAKAIKEAIKEELNLTVSAGVSVNKFVAKIASDMDKPNGLTFIGPSKIVKFMESLPVDKFFGVGKVTAKKMHELGLFTGLDLKKQREEDLVRWFGKTGHFFYRIVRGIDDRPVVPNRSSKSVGIEDTFGEDVEVFEELNTILQRLCKQLWTRIGKKEISGRTLNLKIKYADFVQLTRSITLENSFDSEDKIYATAHNLLSKVELVNKVRLLGVSISNFVEEADFPKEGIQLALFEQHP